MFSLSTFIEGEFEIYQWNTPYQLGNTAALVLQNSKITLLCRHFTLEGEILSPSTCTKLQMYLWSCAQPTEGKQYYKNICKED